MASKSQSLFSHPTFCVITGASKGLGRCMAVRFAAKFPANSLIVLMARSQDQLEKTRQLVKDQSSGIRVKVAALDLGRTDAAKLDALFLSIYNEFNVKASDFKQGLIVHNAASLGDVSKRVQEFDDTEALRAYFDLNLTSVLVLNSVFFKHFNASAVSYQTVVQTSSICALQPFKTWSLYCSAKAARDMLFRTMALEESDIRVLNYAPGPVDTDMQVEARTCTGDKAIKDMFQDLHSQSKLLTCDESIDKLVRLLENNTFDSGAHIDYYDM